MAYTVRELAEMSGVSARTLHWYDKIGLLKPAYYGSNGYRYYEEEQLLSLQQILFYRELGFELKKIKAVLGQSSFNKIAALSSHRNILQRNLEKTQRLIKTIDKTINHLKGEKKMKDKEIFDGFNISLIEKKAGQTYSEAEIVVLESVKRPTNNKQEVEERKAFYEEIAKRADLIFKKLVDCIEKGLDANSLEVQKIIEKHHNLTMQVHEATKKVYKALAKLYLEHPDFRKQLAPFHPQLPTFMAEAMKNFAEKKLR